MFFFHLFMWFIFGRSKKKHQKNVVILGGQNVCIMLVLIGFSEMLVFVAGEFLLTICLKIWRAKSVHGRIPWAQNTGNPGTKLVISLFCLYMCFFVFWKSMKNDDFPSPFGITILVKTVIFNRFQRWFGSYWFFGRVDLVRPLCRFWWFSRSPWGGE